MKVTEIFYSIQGESSWAGLPCVFVRTTGCHLRCVWCDTDYAFYGGRDLSVAQVVEQVEQVGGGCRLVQLTGGEPLLHKDIGLLAQDLLDRGYTVLCETSGSIEIDRLPAAVIKIMDIKCPGSGEDRHNLWSNVEKLGPQDELKFVIRDRRDYDWAVAAIAKWDLGGRRVLFAPVTGELEPRTLAEWMLADNLPARLQLQLHKVIWNAHETGV
ncbi:MAG: radical SAM protein [Gemmatimonadales bacterium]|jgi:7-carboxy-7-deazaguanine synthase